MDARPFGLCRPNEVSYNRAYVHLSTPLGGALFLLEDAFVGYFPSAADPTHVVVWHNKGVMIIPYEVIECLGPDRR